MNLEILIIASIVSVACVIPGVFLLLRRMSLMSDAISHAILPGIVAGFFLGGSLSSPLTMVGAVAASMATVFLTELLYKTRLVKSDAAIGIVFPAMFSLGVILVTLYAGNVHLDTDAVLLGELAFAPLDRVDLLGLSLPRSLVKMSAILALNLGLAALFFKELKLSTFDAGLSSSLGFAPAALNYGLMLATSVTAVGAFDSVGSILVVALMIAPAASALLLTDRLSRMLVYAALIAVGSSVAGFFLARALDAGIAGAMAAMTGLAFFLAFLFSPKRGLVVRAAERRGIRRDFDLMMLAVHLLHHENTPGMETECRVDHLMDHIDWNEEASLTKQEAEDVVQLVRKAGFAATRSSVHVNFGPPHFDKLSACMTVVRQVLGSDGNDLDPYVFVGDALNDAPMFRGFPKSVGVANVKLWWDELDAKPAYLTEKPEGAGMRELVDHVLGLVAVAK